MAEMGPGFRRDDEIGDIANFRIGRLVQYSIRPNHPLDPLAGLDPGTHLFAPTKMWARVQARGGIRVPRFDV